MDRPDGLDEFARNLIRRHAGRLAQRANFTHQDRADLEQALTLRLLKNLDRFDPARGTCQAFVTTVIRNAAASLLRDRSTQKRADTNTRSLQTGAFGKVRPHDPVDPCSRIPDDRPDLALDVADAIAALSLRLRDLAERLMQGTKTEVADEMEVSRGTIRRRVSELLRHFEDAGLRIYLES